MGHDLGDIIDGRFGFLSVGLSIMLLAGGGCLQAAHSQTTSSDSMSEPEYEVLRAYLQAKQHLPGYARGSLVISDSTIIPGGSLDSSTVQFLSERFEAELGERLVADFRGKNRTSYQVHERLESIAPTLSLPVVEIRLYLKPVSSRYIPARTDRLEGAILKLSRVGFSGDRRRALLHCAFRIGPVGLAGGEDQYILMEKREGEWKVQGGQITREY